MKTNNTFRFFLLLFVTTATGCAVAKGSSSVKETAVQQNASATSTSAVVYYSGTAITTLPAHDSSGVPTVVSAPYLVQRTTDQAAGTITEVVTSRGKDGKFKDNTSVMTIQGNTFTMTESTGMVTGNGTLTGTPWSWTYLKGEFSATYGGQAMKIHDVNFFAAPGYIMGHKDIEFPVGTLMLQEDVTLPAVDQASFEATKAQLLNQ